MEFEAFLFPPPNLLGLSRPRDWNDLLIFCEQKQIKQCIEHSKDPVGILQIVHDIIIFNTVYNIQHNTFLL